jgi:hypothetical protein
MMLAPPNLFSTRHLVTAAMASAGCGTAGAPLAVEPQVQAVG